MKEYCVCCGREMPEGYGLVCVNCERVSVEELSVRSKLYDIISEAMKPVEYGGGLYNPPEVHFPTEADILDAMLKSGLIKLNLGGKK